MHFSATFWSIMLTILVCVLPACVNKNSNLNHSEKQQKVDDFVLYCVDETLDQAVQFEQPDLFSAQEFSDFTVENNGEPIRSCWEIIADYTHGASSKKKEIRESYEARKQELIIVAQHMQARMNDIPVPIDATYLEYYQLHEYGDQSCMVGYLSALSPDILIAYYQRELLCYGWEMDEVICGPMCIILAHKPTQNVIIMLRAHNDVQTHIMVTEYAPRQREI